MTVVDGRQPAMPVLQVHGYPSQTEVVKLVEEGCVRGSWGGVVGLVLTEDTDALPHVSGLEK